MSHAPVRIVCMMAVQEYIPTPTVRVPPDVDVRWVDPVFGLPILMVLGLLAGILLVLLVAVLLMRTRTRPPAETTP